jgi:transposase
LKNRIIFSNFREPSSVVSSCIIYIDVRGDCVIIAFMFIRVNTTPNSPRKSIQIVESVRHGNKVKQKIIRYVGVATNNFEEQKLKDLAKQYMAKIFAAREKESAQRSLLPASSREILAAIKNKKGRPRRKKIEDILPPDQVRLSEIKEEARIIEGVHDVAGTMFDELYSNLFKSKRATKIIKDIVLARLICPASKQRSQQYLEKQFGKIHSLDAIYRMMDMLYPKIGEIKKYTYEKTRMLFPEKIDLLFFDVTTLYFESIAVDELRNFGYSKDYRFNTTQVVLALATNSDGLPVGYELFEGNKAEVSTLACAIEAWKKSFNIGSVCFVGDRALFTNQNLALLEQHGYRYIIAAKLRKLPKPVQQRLFEEGHYRPTVLSQSLAWVGEFAYQNARLIVSYKSSRALKDQKERQVVLNKIEKSLGRKGNSHKLITNAGVKKFVTKDENAVINLDAVKIAQDAQWDGLHGIITNITNDTPEALIARYARLWVIEESFRVNKHTLQMRPIFHWKPQRIHSHIAICYMTFSVLRHLQYRVNLTQKISIDNILEALMSVQSSIHVHKRTKDRYRVPGYFTNDARKIYKTYGLERSLDAAFLFKKLEIM